MATAHQIEKLGAYNYPTWVTDIKYLLLEKNCYNIVLAKEETPHKSDPGFLQKDYNECISRKRLSLTLIYLNINPGYRKIIENLDDPVEVCSTLKRNFQSDNRSYHLLLFNQLVNCQMRSSEKINLFASRLKGIADQLINIRKPIDEVYVSFIFLKSLPSKFDTIAQNVLRWEETKLVFKDILAEIITEETRMQFCDCDSQKSHTHKIWRYFMCRDPLLDAICASIWDI
ncbi:retrovirus-related Pol polyprotein from transposon TNT 1-94 [Trichonephila clavipes]|nr:retrovirus-related Pol polyprotein from transposon TNT 1-94 [Trichonephila clavipes]